MRESLLQYLFCPKCHADLVLRRADESLVNDIDNGSLDCVSCKASFPIIKGIPRFVDSNNYTNSFGMQWNMFKKTQLDSFTGTTVSRDRFFKQSGWEPAAMKGTIVLDAGCGAGRFTEISVETGATVIAIDYSTAVDACWDNLKHNNNLHVVQADIYTLPFKPNLFNYIYSFGVLQHTPDVKESFFSLLKNTANNGKICVDCYKKDWRAYFWVKYWLRPITKRMPMSLLFRIVQKIVPFFLPLSYLLIKVPVIGRYLRYALPVVNHKGVFPLNEQQLMEWSILDTFDMYSAKYDRPQTIKTIKEWFREAKLDNFKVLNQGVIVGQGKMMRSAS